MRVDVEEMRCGASLSYSAAWLADEAAGQLSRMAVHAEMFGSFPGAQSFCAAIGRTHGVQLDLLRHHETRLNTVGDQAHTAAAAFEDMETRNAQALRSAL